MRGLKLFSLFIKVCLGLERSQYPTFFWKVPHCWLEGGGSSAGAGWQKTAVCLSSSSAVRCPGTLPAQGSTPLLEGNIWYQLLSGRGSPRSLLPSFKAKRPDWGRLGLPIILQSWRRKWPWDGVGWCCVLGVAVLCSKTEGERSWLSIEGYTLSYEKKGVHKLY